MAADQAIFTSMNRRGNSGYHLVARSPGITETEAGVLTRMAPSHGGLTADADNPVSVNFHPLPGGRFVIARTCEGRPEYSGRGAKQVYTHALVVDADQLKLAGFRPFDIYRDALALGYFHYQPEPGRLLKPVPLSQVHATRDEGLVVQVARQVGRRVFDSLVARIDAGQDVVIPFDGNRARLAEALILSVPPETVLKISFATSLEPSSVRPYRVHLVAAVPAEPSRPS